VNLSRSQLAARSPEPASALTIGQLLEQVAQGAPDALALVDGCASPDRRRWTYAQLWDHCVATAHELLRTCAPGDRFAICAPNGADWVVLEYAAALAGLVIVGINPASSPAEIRYLLEQSGATAMATIPRFRENDLWSQTSEWLAELPSLRRVIDLDAWAPPSRSKGGVALPTVKPSDAALIQYTSGTTGRPKGAVLTHSALLTNSRIAMRDLGLTKPLVLLNVLPMHHIGGTQNNTLGTLWARGMQVIQPWDAELALSLIDQEGVTYLTAVPTMLLAMMEHPVFGLRQLDSVEHITTGGTTVWPELLSRSESAFGCDVGIIFGQTEAGGVIAMSERGDGIAERVSTVGRPLRNTDVQVVDAATLEVVPCGVVGEFWVRSPSVMREYFGMPDLTRETLTPDGWIRTGDLGTMNVQGYVQVTGRLKDMIIRGGENVYAREIEDRLLEHAAVAEAAVVGVPDARLGEEIAAFVRPHPAARLAVADLTAHVADALARHKVPRIWIAVGDLPLTASGKVKKFELRASYVAGDHTPMDAGNDASGRD
jgi:fatty-acyl-CoA synthase